MPNLNPSFVPFYDFEEFVNKAKKMRRTILASTVLMLYKLGPSEPDFCHTAKIRIKI